MKFSSIEQAIKFAYNMSRREIIAKVRLDGDGGSVDGLGPHDLHAQAAMILAAVGRLPDHMRHAVNLSFAPVGSKEKLEAIGAMMDYLSPSAAEFNLNSEQAALVVNSLARSDEHSIRRVSAYTGLPYRRVREARLAMLRQYSDLLLRSLSTVEAWMERPEKNFI